MKSIAISEAINKAAIRDSMNGIFFANENFELIYTNKSCLNLLGYQSEEDITGESIDKLFFDDHEFSSIESNLIQAEKWQGYLTIKNPNGLQFEILCSLESVTVDEVNSKVWKGTLLKIDETLEKSSVKQDNRFHNLLESSPDAILIVNEEGTIKLCNSRVEDMMGYEKSELMGKPVEKLIPEAKRATHKHHRARYNKDPYKRSMGSGLDLYAQRKDGSEFPVDIMLGPLKEQGQLHIIAIVRDVTDFKKSQQKLEREKAFTTLVQEITQIANQARNTEQAYKKSIQKICQFMDWPVGHVYLPANDGTGEFFPSNIWHLDKEDTFTSFKKMTMCTRFAPGVGMVGDTTLTGNPQWYESVHEDTRFLRRMPETDLNVRACIGVPVVFNNKVMAVLEFFSTDVLSRHKTLTEMMETIGKQLGQAVNRIETNKKLKQSRTKFKTLFDTAHDAILIFNKQELINCNESTVQLFQRSANTLSNTSVYSFLPEKQPDGQKSKNIVKQRIARTYLGEDQFFELQFEQPDGTTFHAEVSLIQMIFNQKIHIQATLRDITDRKEADRKLKKNMQLFSQLFENSPGSVVLLDKNMTILNANESFTSTFGYQATEIQGKNLAKFFIPDDQQEQSQKKIQHTLKGNSTRFESKRIHKDGTEIPVVVDTAPVTIHGNTEAVFKIYVDISQQKRIENKLRSSLDDKEVLLREIHHRVKNNLAVVSGLLELQISHTKEPGAVKKLRESQSRIHSMGLVHEQMYQVDSFAALNLEEYIRELAQSIKSTFDNESKDITMEFQFWCEHSLELNLDQAIPCGQLLNELLTNAFKHAFQDQDEGTITISLSEPNNSIKLQVSDNGCGIPDNILDMQTNSLGLTLVQNLVSQLQGSLDIENQDGTTFTITFPKAEEI